MARYVLLLRGDPAVWDDADDAGREAIMAAHGEFETYVDEHGRRLGGAALAGDDVTTTVRPAASGPPAAGDRGAREAGTWGSREAPVVSDGPYAEVVEQIGGFYHVELPDLDHAIAAAALFPAYYVVEIRPELGIV